MLSDHEIGWLAGFIDGEGSVGIYPQRRAGTWTPSVQLRHTHEPTVVYITCLLGRLDVRAVWLCEARPAHHKDSFYARIVRMEEIVRLGEAVAPFSVTKVEQWGVVLAWCVSRLARPKQRSPYTNEELALAHVASTMNRRGKSAA